MIINMPTDAMNPMRSAQVDTISQPTFKPIGNGSCGIKVDSTVRSARSNGHSRFKELAFGITWALLLIVTGCGGGGGNGNTTSPPPAPPPQPPAIANFSDYYPLTKGTSRTYDVLVPGTGMTAVTESWTSGLTYNNQASVRTCESPLEWEDQAHLNGQTISYAFSDDAGNIGCPSQIFVRGGFVDVFREKQTLSVD